MNPNKLLKELCKLEIKLHQPEVRSNAEQLDALLHDSFVEFGRSGQSYSKAEIIKQLPLENSSESVWSQDFTVEVISEGVALLMYKSAHKNETGELTRQTNRSSLWQLTDRGWQMRFHQGTATSEFVASAT
jgi:hypothetical protein